MVANLSPAGRSRGSEVILRQPLLLPLRASSPPLEIASHWVTIFNIVAIDLLVFSLHRNLARHTINGSIDAYIQTVIGSIPVRLRNYTYV